jgi:hypothetical protein
MPSVNKASFLLEQSRSLHFHVERIIPMDFLYVTFS